jgi:hypothetical protein
MRKLLLLAVPLFVLGSFGVAQASHHKALAKTAVCHKVSSTTAPYERVVVVGSKQLKTYTANAADIIPAPAVCPKTLLSPTSTGKGITSITTNMLGVAEQPDPADPDGKGTAIFRLRQGEGQVCYSLNVTGTGLSTGAHIHKGAYDATGPVYVPLGTPNASGTSSGCAPVTSRLIVADILKNPSLYYVNVHNAEFANGAVRGQLQRPTNISLLVGAPMAGANEKPNPGDTDGTGTSAFQIDLDRNRLCYTLQAANIALPATAAHIHRGDGSISGPVVIPFIQPGASGTSSGCVAVDGALLREIVTNPAGFYSNIHSTEFPGGAVRAPLSVAS